MRFNHRFTEEIMQGRRFLYELEEYILDLERTSYKDDYFESLNNIATLRKEIAKLKDEIEHQRAEKSRLCMDYEKRLRDR